MSPTRRIVRATPRFFEDLDRQVRAERGPNGEPSTNDFQVFEPIRRASNPRGRRTDSLCVHDPFVSMIGELCDTRSLWWNPWRSCNSKPVQQSFLPPLVGQLPSTLQPAWCAERGRDNSTKSGLSWTLAPKSPKATAPPPRGSPRPAWKATGTALEPSPLPNALPRCHSCTPPSAKATLLRPGCAC